MTWIVEDPLTIAFAGLALAVVAAVILAQLSQGKALVGALAVAALTGILLLVEWLVVTDREQVENTLDATAAAVSRNDMEGALTHFSPRSSQLIATLRSRAKGVKFTEAKITSNPQITIHRLTSPPSASASFIGRISAELHGYGMLNGTPGQCKVKLVRDGERWLIDDVQFEGLKL